MKAKNLVIVVLILSLAICILMFSLYVCGNKQGGKYGSLENKVSRKAHFLIKNQKTLGLSGAQVRKIESLENRALKDSITKRAQIKMIAVDIRAEMRKDDINTRKVNKLIDQKYAVKKAKTKSLINTYAALKGLLTAEQKEKMKELCYGRRPSGIKKYSKCK